MKKTLVSALTTALVVGAASTTFAAANPFADVPAGHWAYDAVTELASKGIVDGYAVDGTFKGDQTMTRYEMAQIVAKAMAKIQVPAATNTTVINGADKAMVEKLSAEFSDELANLGVRVKDLESKVDNVKWTGFLRYEYKNRGGDLAEKQVQRVKLRLTPTMKINDQWTGHARLEFAIDANAAHNGGQANWAGGWNGTQFRVDQMWVDGNVGKVAVKAGKFGVWDQASHGLAMDDAIVGVQGSVALSDTIGFDAAVGRYSWYPSDAQVSVADPSEGYATGTWTYAGAELTYAKGKFDAGVSYRTFRGATATADQFGANMDTDHIDIVSAGAGYQFTPALYATVDYSRTNAAVDSQKNSYHAQLNWQATKKIGLFVGYQKLSDPGTLTATYDLQRYTGNGQKGWLVGTNLSLSKNVSATAIYLDAKECANGMDRKFNMFYGNLNFAF